MSHLRRCARGSAEVRQRCQGLGRVLVEYATISAHFQVGIGLAESAGRSV